MSITNPHPRSFHPSTAICSTSPPHTSQRLMSAPKAGKPMKGKVAELWRYPVSSMAGEQLAVARVEAGGIAGDRIWGVLELNFQMRSKFQFEKISLLNKISALALAGAGGIEPPNGGIKIRCLTAWLRPNRLNRNGRGRCALCEPVRTVPGL
jgi:hypothetical protein